VELQIQKEMVPSDSPNSFTPAGMHGMSLHPRRPDGFSFAPRHSCCRATD